VKEKTDLPPFELSNHEFQVWLSEKRSLLDRACGEAIAEGLSGLSPLDLNRPDVSLRRLYKKSSSVGDCDYDLKGIAALYTGHWQGKRVHDALQILVPLVPRLARRKWSIVELGAGTGAVLWAWTLIACFAHEKGTPLPIHTWTSLDASQEMATQSNRLWKSLCESLPLASRVVDRKPPIVDDWRNLPAVPRKGIVISSYLFSWEEADDPEATAASMTTFVHHSHAFAILFWTKASKSPILKGVESRLESWTTISPSLFRSPLKGAMSACEAAAREAFRRIGVSASKTAFEDFHWGGASTDASLLLMTRGPTTESEVS
jgi:hypothetical protein